jgi:twinkle protein
MTQLEKEHLDWLAARGISAELAAKFGLKSAVQSFPPDADEGEKWVRAKAIAIPYRRGQDVFNHKYRRTSRKKHVMDKGAPLGLWNEAALDQAIETGRPWVITEGEWDALLANDLGWAASSVPNGAPNAETKDLEGSKRYEFLWDHADKIAKVKNIIIAADGDEAGQYLRQDLIGLFGPTKCSFLEYPADTKDLTDVYTVYGVEAVSQVLNDAKPVPVQGIYKLKDFPQAPEVTIQPVLVDGISIGNKEYDLWGLVPATTTIITGYPGQGKTSLVMKMVANLLLGGTRITMASFETIPRPIIERKLLACMCGLGEFDPYIYRNQRALDALHENLVIIANTPDDDHELDLERVMDLFETGVARHGSKLTILDPWNEMDHKRGRDESETDYTGRAIRTFKRFTHRTHTAMWVVAHPRKPSTDGMPKHPPSLYDLAGSANWYNKADYGLVVHRHDLSTSEIQVIVPKVRMGLPGRIGSVTLEYQSSRSSYGLVACDD